MQEPAVRAAPLALLPHSSAHSTRSTGGTLVLQACLHPTLTNLPGAGVIALQLLAADDVPDAGHPVRQQREHGHEQRQHHGAVLRVPIQLLQQPQQPQQPHRLQQVNQRGLGGGQEGEPGGAAGRDKKGPQHHPQGRNPLPPPQLPGGSWATGHARGSSSPSSLAPLCTTPSRQPGSGLVRAPNIPRRCGCWRGAGRWAAALLWKAAFVPVALTTVTLKM